MEESEEKHEHRFETAPLPLQIKLLNEKLVIQKNEELKEHGLTFSQMTVMMYLKHNRDHKISQKELCEAIHVKHPTMIGLVGRLEEKGLVSQKVDEANRRFKLIELTDKGLVLMSKSREDAIRNDAKLVAGMSEEQKKQLCESLIVIYQNLLKEEELRIKEC